MVRQMTFDQDSSTRFSSDTAKPNLALERKRQGGVPIYECHTVASLIMSAELHLHAAGTLQRLH